MNRKEEGYIHMHLKFYGPLYIVGFFILIFFYMILTGCAEMPEREMDEHFMHCLIMSNGEAFCK